GRRRRGRNAPAFGPVSRADVGADRADDDRDAPPCRRRDSRDADRHGGGGMNAAPLVALVGNPNSGKSALFNALTGARQKVGNYPGVTVERHSGRMALNDGRPVELVDLPGTYSPDPSSPDEQV